MVGLKVSAGDADTRISDAGNMTRQKGDTMGIVNDMHVARAALQAMDVLRVAADAFSEGHDGPLRGLTLGQALRLSYDTAREMELVDGPPLPGEGGDDTEPPFALIVAAGAITVAHGDSALNKYTNPSLMLAFCVDAIGILAGSMDGGVRA